LRRTNPTTPIPPRPPRSRSSASLDRPALEPKTRCLWWKGVSAGAQNARNAPDDSDAEAGKGEGIRSCTIVKGDTFPRAGISIQSANGSGKGQACEEASKLVASPSLAYQTYRSEHGALRVTFARCTHSIKITKVKDCRSTVVLPTKSYPRHTRARSSGYRGGVCPFSLELGVSPPPPGLPRAEMAMEMGCSSYQVLFPIKEAKWQLNTGRRC
jgi:hypothetical protein